MNSRFQKIQKLGEGSYGKVYKTFDTLKRQVVALKKIKLGEEDEGIPPTAIREMSILRELAHNNIIHLCDLIYEFKKRKLYLIFEYMDFDLRKFIDSQTAAIPVHLIRSIFGEIVKGVDYCHENNVFHRDLKPQNILLSTDGSQVKIADFGLSRHFNIPFKLYSKEIVTLWYRAPEIIMGSREYGIGVDIWSLGCIFAELFLKKPLFMGDCQIQQLFTIFNVLGSPDENNCGELKNSPDFSNKFPKFKGKGLTELMKIQGFDSSALDLLEKMLCYDPVKRLTCKEILAHSFMLGKR